MPLFRLVWVRVSANKKGVREIRPFDLFVIKNLSPAQACKITNVSEEHKEHE
jgi:hypothetical protein